MWKRVTPNDPVDPARVRYMAQGGWVRKAEVFATRGDKVAARLWVKNRKQWQWVRWHEWPTFETQDEAKAAAQEYLDRNDPFANW